MAHSSKGNQRCPFLRVFAQIHPLLIDKDLPERRNVSIKFPSTLLYVQFNKIPLNFFFVKVVHFYSCFCIIRTSVFSFYAWSTVSRLDTGSLSSCSRITLSTCAEIFLSSLLPFDCYIVMTQLPISKDFKILFNPIFFLAFEFFLRVMGCWPNASPPTWRTR